jgi:eukaryotic-like serine/threonine-protein kinase
MALVTGARLGHYEILGALGEGGMGEVYRARDPRLDREVALKVLSAALAFDPAALARFEREALSVARLSHPNILSIFEFGRDGATAFVVTELVVGDTLRARLAGGALSPRRATGYALQIARGIAAAHARGIVHRDLKPENVMITRDDQVKILDFGLAKTIDAGEPEMTHVGVHTNVGVVLGTFGYMAPEQVRGLAVDSRADVFAFGAVLYELLSGERAFKGETAADTMTAILTKDPPDLDASCLAATPALDRIVRRCLEKTPELRFQSATDLAFALETLSTTSTSSSAPLDVVAARPRARMAWIPWAVAAIAVVAAAIVFSTRPAPATAEARWATFTRISETAGEETSPTLSPDGSTVAYAMRTNGNWDIYSQRVGGRKATAIVNDPRRNEGGPAFSPDGARIAFHEVAGLGGIFVAGATGESERRLTDAGFDPAWSPDGAQIAFTTEAIVDPAARQGESGLHVVAAGGGSPRRIVDGDAAQASWSPSGGRIVYWSNTRGQRDLYTVAAAGGARVPLTQDAAIDWSPVWSPDGRYVYFSSDRGGAMNLWRIPVNESSGEAQGAPEPVTAGVQASAAMPTFSRDGSRLAFRSQVGGINPVAIPFDPGTMRAGVPYVIDTRTSILVPSDVSPDGKQVAYFSIADRQEDLFIGSADSPIRRVTDDAARDRAPMFSPDGRSLLFYSNRDGNWAAWMIGVDGGGLRKVAAPGTGVIYPLLSPKGDEMVYTSDDNRAAFLVRLDSSLTGTPVELRGGITDATFSPTGWSPDGRRLAGQLLKGTAYWGVGVYDLSTHVLVMAAQDPIPAARWLADSRRIVYFTDEGSALIVLDTVTGTRTVVDVRLPAPSTGDMFAISPDNRTIYYGASRFEADIWIVEQK